MATNSSPYLRLILLPPNSKTNDALFVRFARGNARSLWMGVLWALTSGSGVAVALLQGSAGPLIGVAISASLLPPVVNCVSYRAEARLQDEFELILHSGSAHFSFSLSRSPCCRNDLIVRDCSGMLEANIPHRNVCFPFFPSLSHPLRASPMRSEKMFLLVSCHSSGL